MKTTALAPWFGGNRMLASKVGEALTGCSWVGVPFAGGMSELPHITARTILVNDLHRHVINLARVIADGELRPGLIRRLRRYSFHPDELAEAQNLCAVTVPRDVADADLAEAYFICCWMGRSSKAGIDDEFNGRTATRWNANGGDSAVRYFSAIRSIVPFSRVLRRCTFETMDAFEFLIRCEDSDGHGIYADPPFPVAGRRYVHNAGKTDSEERIWHTRLAESLSRFKRTRVVCRFYDHPLVRELYEGWTWLKLPGGRKQSNDVAPEVLVCSGETPSLFTEAT